MEDLIYTAAAFAAVIFPVFNLWSFWILHKASKTQIGKTSPALQERTRVAGILTVASLLLAIIGVNRISLLFFNVGLTGSPLPLALIAVVVMLISVPSMLWLNQYFRDGFDK